MGPALWVSVQHYTEAWGQINFGSTVNTLMRSVNLIQSWMRTKDDPGVGVIYSQNIYYSIGENFNAHCPATPGWLKCKQQNFTLLMLTLGYSRINRQILQPLMPWLLVSHNQCSYGIDYEEWASPCLLWSRFFLTIYAISVVRNSSKCKYNFIFPKINFI